MKKIVKAFTVLACLLMLSAPTVLALDCCEGDFNCDRDVDGSDLFIYATDHGRADCPTEPDCSCPSCPDAFIPPAPVPKTGNTNCNTSGEDGCYQEGVEWPNPRFTDNGDGTATDNLTGLIWLKDANCFGTRTWSQALSDCNGLAEGEDCDSGSLFVLSDGSGAGDWRLPNVKELLTLIDFGKSNPALISGHPFINVQTDLQPDDYYYSSTTYNAYAGGAWAVRMFDGYVNGHYKTNSYYVWPVRGGQ